MLDDLVIINAAFEKIKELESIYGDSIPSVAIRNGFDIDGENIRLENQVVGIFKPRQMKQGALSIKTTMSRDGDANIYNDQLVDSGYYKYSLQEGDPYGVNNKYLWQSLESKMPFIYFHAVAPAVYKALWPCFIKNIFPEERHALVALGPTVNDQYIDSYYRDLDDIESRYLVRESKVRLHQASFREAVMSAYNRSCAVTGLSVEKLIEAAHIIPDSEIGKHQSVTNGIALNRIHHKAYDSNLIGIDPDLRIHVGKELIEIRENRFIKDCVLRFDNKQLNSPSNPKYAPNKDYLARRFEKFELSNN